MYAYVANYMPPIEADQNDTCFICNKKGDISTKLVCKYDRETYNMKTHYSQLNDQCLVQISHRLEQTKHDKIYS